MLRKSILNQALKRPEIWIVFTVGLMAVLRSDSLSPALPGMSLALALPPNKTGLVLSMFVLPGIAVSPFLGILADRWGRKRILVVSLVVFGLAGAACALARNLETLLILRLVQGIGAAAISPFNIILVADLFEGEERPAMMGYNATVRVLGSIFFPLAAGVLAVYTWRLPFLLPLLALPFAFFILRKLQDAPRVRKPMLREYFAGMSVHLRRPASLAVFLAGMVVVLVMDGAYFTYLPFLLGERFDLSPSGVGALMASRSIVAAMVAYRFGQINRALGLAGVIRWSCLLYGLSLALMPLARSGFALAGVTVLIGLAEGLYWPANHYVIGSLAPAENRAGYVTINDSVLKTGQFVGPLLMGLAYNHWHADGVFWVAGGLLLVTLFAITLLFRRDTYPASAAALQPTEPSNAR